MRKTLSPHLPKNLAKLLGNVNALNSTVVTSPESQKEKGMEARSRHQEGS